ncbi:MAG: DUF1501 domain-containing protein [Bacteroidota bacterium]
MKKLISEFHSEHKNFLQRRHFLRTCGMGMGAMALGNLLGCAPSGQQGIAGGLQGVSDMHSHFPGKAKTVIFLHMAGAPSQLELFDYKPVLHKYDGQDCPQELLEGKRFAFIVGTPKMLGPQAEFKQYGQSGSWVSNHLPYFKEVVDDVCFLKGMQTDEFNHAPAQMFMHTGSARPGRPSMGSWLTYGLGSVNENLPGFIVLVSGNSQPSGGKGLWGSGFLPSLYQGVQFRSKGEPVLYVSDPKGMPRDLRKATIDAITEINELQFQEVGDPEILSRVAQYEMAFKMQTTVPEAMDISSEPEYIKELYGIEPGKVSFANNCLLARRLAERGVRFIQLYHRGWDSHGSNEFEALEGGFLERCREVDQPMTALVKDLKQRGMMEDVLVVWGGEFGRTPMRENRGGKVAPFNGRDHHGEAFTMWATGGGIKTGITYGKTDDIGYYPVEGNVHIHDLQATILRQMGMDHEKLTYKFQGRDFRLTDVHGKVVRDILG